MRNLVGQRQLFIKAIEMPDRSVDIDGFHRIAAGEMDAVEILRQLDEVPVGFEITGAFAPFKVPGIGRRRDIAEQDMPAPHGNCAVGVAGGDGEFGRGAGHHLGHEIGVEADGLAFDDAARTLEMPDRVLVQELDPDLGKDAQGGVVQILNPVRRQRFDGGIGVDGNAPGRLFDRGVPGTVGMALAAPRAAAACWRGIVHGRSPPLMVADGWSRAGG